MAECEMDRADEQERQEKMRLQKERRAAYLEANKDRIRAKAKEWREANAEHLKKAKAEWHRNNPQSGVKSTLKRMDAIRAYAKEYYWRNTEKVSEKRKEFREKNKERLVAAVRKWRANNVNHVRQYNKKYKQENSELVRVHVQNRRALRVADGNKLSTNIADTLFKKQRGRCIGCRASLRKTGYHIDHVIALSRGGTNTDSNVQLLCPPCNQAKHAKHPVEFMQSRGFLL
jgi:5-methylcytosine-specific restriction endonuclease McrA